MFLCIILPPELNQEEVSWIELIMFCTA